MRDGKAAKRLFGRVLKTHQRAPTKFVTDKLQSYDVAHRELIPESIHDTSKYANNRAELSQEPTRVRERGMRRFKSSHQAQRFLTAYSAVFNLFKLGRLPWVPNLTTPVAPHVLDRRFDGWQPNQAWVGDITYSTPSQPSRPVWWQRCLSILGMQFSMEVPL